MKVDFKKLSVEVSFDKFSEVDVTKALGNYIHANTSDIGLDDTARAIYHSEGEFEIPDEHVEMIHLLVNNKKCPLLASVKRAIFKTLSRNG